MEKKDISYHLSEDSQVLTVTISKYYRSEESWSKQLQDLSKLPKLKDLRIENEGTTTIEDFEGVFRAVEVNSSLTQVSFKDQGLGPRTFINSDWFRVFNDFETNTTVTYLSLENLASDCIVPIAYALRRNKTLQSLTIKDKLLTKQDLRILYEALMVNMSLVRLTLPNHLSAEPDYKSAMSRVAENKKYLALPYHKEVSKSIATENHSNPISVAGHPEESSWLDQIALQKSKEIEEMERWNKELQKRSIKPVLDAQKIQQLTTEGEQFKQENNALKSEISQLKQEIEELKHAKHSLSDTNKQLQNGIQNLDRIASAARSELTLLVQEYDKQGQEMRSLQEEVRTLREQHSKCQQNVKSNNTFEEENKALKREIDDLKRDLAHGASVDIPHHEITLGDPIGAGTFGEVFKAHWHGQNIAVKRIKLSTLGQSSFENLMHESRTVMRLHHKHIVLSMGTTQRHDTEELMLVMEYMKHGSLHSLLFPSVGKSVKLERHQIIQLALDVAKGLNYLHCLTPKIIHRDLKCENILLYHNKTRAKISDFGTARFLNKNSVARTIHGTLGYVAPEVLEEQDYDEKADVFSFGMVLLVLATSCANLPTMRDATRLRNRINEILATSLEDNDGLKRLIIDCCQVSPAERPSVKQCIEVLKALRQKDTNDEYN